jgi:hypothetical protein
MAKGNLEQSASPQESAIGGLRGCEFQLGSFRLALACGCHFLNNGDIARHGRRDAGK